jgi:hypothetical protein
MTTSTTLTTLRAARSRTNLNNDDD